MTDSASTNQPGRETWRQKVCNAINWETAILSLLGVVILCLATWGATVIILGDVQLQLEYNARSILARSSKDWPLCPRTQVGTEANARQISAAQVQAYYVMSCQIPGVANNRTWNMTSDMVARLVGSAPLSCPHDLLSHQCYTDEDLTAAYWKYEEITESLGKVNMTDTDECYLNVAAYMQGHSLTTPPAFPGAGYQSIYELHDIILFPNGTFVIRWFTPHTEVRYYIEVQQSQPKSEETNVFKDLAVLLSCNLHNIRGEVEWMLKSQNSSEFHEELQHLNSDIACIANRNSILSVVPNAEYPILDKYQCTQGIDNEFWSQWQDALAFAKVQIKFSTPVWPKRLSYDELIAVWSSVLGALFSGVLAAAAVLVYVVCKCCWVAIEPGLSHLGHEKKDGSVLVPPKSKQVDQGLTTRYELQTRTPMETKTRGLLGPRIARERLTGNPTTLLEY